MPRRNVIVSCALALTAPLTAACIDEKSAQKAVESILSGPPKPDVLPAMLNPAPPFHYPSELYARKVQGNITLRIFIDERGQVHPESTMVVEPSGYPALDSAAIAGVPALRFRPAALNGKPMAVTILFPVFFRHPDAAPLPGDTVLRKKAKD